MMAKPMKTLELHYPMIQFLIIKDYLYHKSSQSLITVLAFHQVRMVVCLNPNAEDYDESVVRCLILMTWLCPVHKL